MEFNELREKVDGYYIMVQEHQQAGRNGDSAVNIRHILEIIVNEYVEKYVPSMVFAKIIEKIDALQKNDIIDETSANTLHQLRKLANKGAHGEGDSISSEDLKRVIPPLKMEIDKFYEKIGNNEFNEELDKKINSLDSVIAHACVELYHFDAKTKAALLTLLEDMQEFEDNEKIQEYIKEVEKRLEEVNEKEKRLKEIREKNQMASKMIINDGYYLYIETPTHRYYRFNFRKADGRCYRAPIEIELKREDSRIKKVIASSYGKIVLYHSGHVYFEYYDFLCKCNREKWLKDDSYGVWDDIIDVCLDRAKVYGLSKKGYVRTKTYGVYREKNEYKIYDSVNIYHWNEPNKKHIRFLNNDILLGINKDNSFNIISLYSEHTHWRAASLSKEAKEKRVDIVNFLYTMGEVLILTSEGIVESLAKNSKIQKHLKTWNDIVSVSGASNHVLGLKADGTVRCIYGTNVNQKRLICTKVGQWKEIVEVYAFDFFSIGLKKDGTFVCCGEGYDVFKNIRVCKNLFSFDKECELQSEITKQKDFIDTCNKEKMQLEIECNRTKNDNEKIFEWIKRINNKNEISEKKRRISELEQQIVLAQEEIIRIQQEINAL